ncbi:DUF1566 domain-containing protein [Pseudomonas sp. CCM 7893]|uniref:DUF1566 domain-containing protein n=1 Tax=Pseudomonas spelaei TaxID=1055469 RepID=A0A6I3WER4_9PSED|nr:DUF1566 domain-containing protein [Pseudomonas spelaei]MUF08258.1 DUF1566 domain-containing protein [Pseudomonas spelaei]
MNEAGEAPELGSYWVGQGGIYAGIRHYPDGPYHLIVSSDELGDFAWGSTRTRTTASSRINGVLNTTTLLETEGEFPAATAAGNYTADGRYDFYLPSIGELHQVWQYLPNLILEGTYWSSSQRSENHAFCMLFGSGYQFNYEKNSELCVRPFRRLPIR